MNDAPRAACLTPPAAGGVAVIQIVGRDAALLVSPFLRSRRPLDLRALDANDLRLCRLVDGDEIIDDAVVAARVRGDGATVIELNLHGGARIVQRALLLLRTAGVEIVAGAELVDQSWPAGSPIQRELFNALFRARTRAVTSWLMERARELPVELEAAAGGLERGDDPSARSLLERLCAGAGPAQFLFEGVRVVLAGEPNVGKSTLANALAQRDHAIVSDVPGTTRDWVEHPGAVDGVPFTFVDTAGIRETDDPIEREAVRRAREQAAAAAIIVHVLDASAPPVPGDRDAMERAHGGRPVILVGNKSDRPLNAEQAVYLDRAGQGGVRVSALTGEGLEKLQARLIEAAGLASWRDRLKAPFTAAQHEVCRQALAVWEAAPAIRAQAADRLRRVADTRSDVPSLMGYNRQLGHP